MHKPDPSLDPATHFASPVYEENPEAGKFQRVVIGIQPACGFESAGPMTQDRQRVTCITCRDLLVTQLDPFQKEDRVGIPESTLATTRDIAGHIIREPHYARALALAVAEGAITLNTDAHLRRLLKVSAALAHYANVLDD